MKKVVLISALMLFVATFTFASTGVINEKAPVTQNDDDEKKAASNDEKKEGTCEKKKESCEEKENSGCK